MYKKNFFNGFSIWLSIVYLLYECISFYILGCTSCKVTNTHSHGVKLIELVYNIVYTTYITLFTKLGKIITITFNYLSKFSLSVHCATTQWCKFGESGYQNVGTFFQPLLQHVLYMERMKKHNFHFLTWIWPIYLCPLLYTIYWIELHSFCPYHMAALDKKLVFALWKQKKFISSR